jgi:hypothetical protein
MGGIASRLRRRVVGPREVGDLGANKVQADKAHAAGRGIGDARNIALEEVPISIPWAWRKKNFAVLAYTHREMANAPAFSLMLFTEMTRK